MQNNKVVKVQGKSTYPGLLEDSMDPDPFHQFTAWFNEAVRAGIDQPEAMFLATAGSDGTPSGRMVLLKGMDADGFVFFTNYQSHKGIAISQNPSVSVTFYWKELDRQIRITGKAHRTTATESDLYFDSRPLESRIGAVVSPQSSIIPGRAFLEDRFNMLRDDLAGSRLKRPVHWGGYRIRPDRFEFWQAGLHRLHDRIQYRKVRGRWKMERLAP
jgi:pyridoxamine 5'-phosphate oxidase